MGGAYHWVSSHLRNSWIRQRDGSGYGGLYGGSGCATRTSVGAAEFKVQEYLVAAQSLEWLVSNHKIPI